MILEEEPDPAKAEKLAPVWCRYLQAEAIGLMFLSLEKRKLTPLVYVPAAGTMVWENSCASGTTAVGAWLASREMTSREMTSREMTVREMTVREMTVREPADKEKEIVRLSLNEPGGVLEIAAEASGRLLLTGTVEK